MDRIVISVTSLSKENWMVIYQFIRSILNNDNRVSRITALAELQKIASISLKRNITVAQDVYKLDETVIQVPDLDSLTKDTAFSLIYKKEDDSEDFAELVLFILFQEEFKKCISLGIDIDKLDYKKQSNYIFKCSYFFILYNDIPPIHGFRSLYFVNEKNKDSKQIYLAENRVTSLRSNYVKPSSNFLPLIFITEDSYKSLFGTKRDNSKEQQILIESFSKMRKDFAKCKFSKDLELLNEAIYNQDDSFFGKWLECVFFYSLLNGGLESVHINETRESIQIIKTNISELVQNIIFHAGKRGLLYCIFDKMINISEKYQQYLSGLKKYKDNSLFLRAGIFDFSDKGIVDTFTSSEAIEEKYNLTLSNFFDTQIFITTKLSRLDLRHVAHLGIKTFARTITKQKGYFCVETNVSNCSKGNKKIIQTTLNGDEVQLSAETDILFVNGTHYDVVFPIEPSEAIKHFTIPFQKTSLLAENIPNINHNLDQPLSCVKLPEELIKEISICPNKEDQIKGIIKAGNFILKDNEDKKEIALDFGDESITPTIIFKLLSYVQLNAYNGFDRIIIINAKDDFVDQFCSIIFQLIDKEDIDIWSRDNAIILITQNLHAQILWGRSKNEFYYINSELSRYYSYNIFKNNIDIIKFKNSIGNIELDDVTIKKARSFIAPYDVIINTEQNKTPFELFINNLFKRQIISNKLGFGVNHENTYIGNKIIVRNNYEADMMFQNTFFTERFAFLIANNIKQIKNNDKKLVLIGHKHYSRLLLKSIKRALKEEKVYLAIFNDEKEDNDIDNYFNFDIDGNARLIKKEILKSPDSFYFATIVPIGSTLFTNEKIIALFKYWIDKELETKKRNNYTQKNKANSEDEYVEESIINHERITNNDNHVIFIYNHCVIVVRDTTNADVSKLEIEHNWEKDGIDLFRRVIITNYNNAKEVHYTVQLANIDRNDREKYGNWLKRMNQEISFPLNWWHEKYVNFTENSSIYSQNLMGFPRVDVINEKKHTIELARLYELKDYILKGHLNVYNCHHNFYVDTEAFVKGKNDELVRWLNGLKIEYEEAKLFDQDKFNLLITPNAESESDFLYAINNILFDNNALIVNLGIKNWPNNYILKLSFLNSLPCNSVSYHYVDQALLTGETYYQTKSRLFSVLGCNLSVEFSSIITIANRLNFIKNREIKKDVKDKLFAYINLYYPSNENDLQSCESCKLYDYYNWLSSRTVLGSCFGIIKKNQAKLRITQKEIVDPNNYLRSKRSFLRLVITHELLYKISNITDETQDYESNCDSVINELNIFYFNLCNDDSLCRQKDSESIALINSWFKIDFSNEYLNSFYNGRLVTDKRISFLKVITSPPLSHYIVIRKYAYEKLLVELYKVINCKQEYTYDDLKIIKSILKSLSFLKSNALVRKDVIIGVWKVLGIVVYNLENEKKKIETLISLIKREREEMIKSFNSQEHPFDYNIHTLHDNIRIVDTLQTELERDKEILNKQNIIRDFSLDVQFFIKNAIVDDDVKAIFLGELLRQGKEITNFDNIQISKTVLSLKDQKSDNDLFESFNDNDAIERKFINFLVSLFYDNTAIIRKTLDNFTKEINRNENINRLFYEIKGNTYYLRDFIAIVSQIEPLKTLYNKVINDFSYSTFKPYLKNGDKIDYVEKLIYLSYAKLKFKDIIKNKTNIELDAKDLVEVFARIMGADAAFWTMKMNKEISAEKKVDNFYVFAQFGLDNDIEIGVMRDDYYTQTLYASLGKGVKFPLITKYQLPEGSIEKKYLKMSSLGFIPISFNEETYKGSQPVIFDYKRKGIVASITFLYNDNNTYNDDEKSFNVLSQASGKLLLLLKNEIDNYVINYLIK